MVLGMKALETLNNILIIIDEMCTIYITYKSQQQDHSFHVDDGSYMHCSLHSEGKTNLYRIRVQTILAELMAQSENCENDCSIKYYEK